MRILLITIAVVIASFVNAGCNRGPAMVQTMGRIVENGEPVVPDDGQYLQVFFVPLPEDGKPAQQLFHAEVNQLTGTFRAAGSHHNGMPTGKYRVSVELIQKKKDVYKGKYDCDRSPFEYMIDVNTPEIVIDLNENAA